MAPFDNTGLGNPAVLKALPSSRRFVSACLSTLALAAAQFSVSAATPDSAIQYNRDIRPILSENCFACHGADSASRKAGLRLDHFEPATSTNKDGHAAIVPGKPKDSLLVQRITAADPDDIMPPPRTLKTLTAQQKMLLQKWIADGAKYQPLWSFIAPVKPELPKVKNRRWARNPIDNFVLARLEQAGLKPSPEADKRTLCRRVTLDLTGLPPAPDRGRSLRQRHFRPTPTRNSWTVSSPRPNTASIAPVTGSMPPVTAIPTAFISIITARCGAIASGSSTPSTATSISINSPSNNLAATSCPIPRSTSSIATGFNRCNITTSEGGAIDEEYLVLYARDRTDTTCRVWLGLTAGCAVCHDHKFDPLSQKEFYSLTAFFNNTTQKAMDGNIKDTPPAIPVPLATDRAEWDAIMPALKAGEKQMEARRKSGHADYNAWLPTATAKMFADAHAPGRPALPRLAG